MFDDIISQHGRKPDRQLFYHILDMLTDTLHEGRVNKDLLLLIIQKQNKMSQQFDDLKSSIDAVKKDISDINDKVGVVISKLPDGTGLTSDEVQALKDELSGIHSDAGRVEANLDNAVAPPVTTPPVVTPPVETPPVQTPPVTETPVI